MGSKFFGSRLGVARWISNSADFFLRPILEDDMKPFTRSQKLLVSAGAAALGSAGLLTLLGGNIVALAGRGEPPWTYRRPSSVRTLRFATRRL